MPTITELLAGTEPGERLNAEWLLAHYLGQRRSWLYAHGNDPLDLTHQVRLRQDLQHVRSGQPLAYLLGSWEFYGLSLTVTKDTLVPRPETELLVDRALELLPADRPLEVVDLGTGSGAIALALADQRPQARVTAVDVCPAALKVAQGNAGSLGLDRVSLLVGDWWQPLSGRQFDLVVSNPPYVVPGDPRLTARGEPDLALFGGDDGLQAYRAIEAGLSQHLRRGGHLLLEHGLDQRDALMQMFDGQFENLQAMSDLAGHPRIICGQNFRPASGP